MGQWAGIGLPLTPSSLTENLLRLLLLPRERNISVHSASEGH